MSEATRVRHFTLHHSLLATILKRLPAVAENLGKRLFKPFLEEFMASSHFCSFEEFTKLRIAQDGIFYACESDNGLARAAGEQAVSFFSEYLGPNIWRGRVEQYHPRLVSLLQFTLGAT